MSPFLLGQHRILARLMVALSALSLIHIPLPQADFHNVRHHDGPGEYCPFHDHLLAWHPTADTNADVSLLHWHWFVSLEDMGGNTRAADSHHGPGPGPSMHAQQGEGPAFDWSASAALCVDQSSHRGSSDIGSAALVCLAILDQPHTQSFSRRPTSACFPSAHSHALSTRLNC